MSRTKRQEVRAGTGAGAGVALAALAALVAGCGGGGGGEPDSGMGEDAGGYGFDLAALPDGATLVDDAGRAEVAIPVAPRAFRMGVGAILDSRAGAEAVDASWALAHASGEMVAVWLEGGIPWPELRAGEPFPAQFEARIAALEERVRSADQGLLLAIDPLDAGRVRPVGDSEGRELTVAPVFGESEVRRGYVALCEALVERLHPDWLVPVVDLDLYRTGLPDDFDALVRTYEEAREAAKFVDGDLEVFPLFDWESIRYDLDRGDAGAQGMLREIDESIDRFGIAFHPSMAFRGVTDLAEEEFERITPYITRPVVFAATGFPARGFLRNDRVFSSSDNAQYNYLAWVLEEADAVGSDLVVWRIGRDPNLWLDELCPNGTQGESCAGADLYDRMDPFRHFGLENASGALRPAGQLWGEYRARVYRP